MLVGCPDCVRVEQEGAVVGIVISHDCGQFVRSGCQIFLEDYCSSNANFFFLLLGHTRPCSGLTLYVRGSLLAVLGEALHVPGLKPG